MTSCATWAGPEKTTEKLSQPVNRVENLKMEIFFSPSLLFRRVLHRVDICYPFYLSGYHGLNELRNQHRKRNVIDLSEKNFGPAHFL